VEAKMKKTIQDDAAVGPAAERFQGLKAYLSALQPHVSRAGPQDLTCMLIVAQSITGLAPALGLTGTRKRALTLQIVVRGILTRGKATAEELGVLARAYDRLTATARQEGAL
jgi:hypothetical protein